jgi:flagellar basal-body rod protein FlgB
MDVSGVTSSGALPALEMVIRFAGQRQRLIANNIANFETPNYQPKDVSPAQFQRVLGEAIDARREGEGKGMRGELEWQETREIKRGERGGLSLEPRTPSGNILFHDRNNRDIERTMQAMVENTATFRVATELYRSQVGLLQAAISERV